MGCRAFILKDFSAHFGVWTNTFYVLLDYFMGEDAFGCFFKAVTFLIFFNGGGGHLKNDINM